jgi:peroxiredoxin Q/BCP
MPGAPKLKLQEGDPAPPFSAQTQDGRRVSLADFKGQPVVLYFYPRDDTPGCTREACAFRDAFEQFRKRGVVVLGVSVDDAESHRRFAEKHRLPFPLLADPERTIVRAYGVWGTKTFLGRKFQGTHRVTFLIGPDGRIQKIWPKVKPDTHAAEVLAALEGASGRRERKP